MAKRKSSIKKIVLILLILLLLIGAIAGFAVKSSNDKNNGDSSSFGVSVNGDVVSENKTSFSTDKDNALSVDVLLPKSFTRNDLTYYYGIVPNADINLSFYVDFTACSFKDWEIDVDKCFDIAFTDTGFTLSPKANTLTELLKLCYPQSNIFIRENDVDYSKDLFYLVVKSKDEQSVVVGIKLLQPEKPPTVEFDYKEMFF